MPTIRRPRRSPAVAASITACDTKLDHERCHGSPALSTSSSDTSAPFTWSPRAECISPATSAPSSPLALSEASFRATPSRRRGKRSAPARPAGHIPRPPNKFMLYRRSKAAEIKRRLRSGESGSHMSQIAGAMWATESAAVKAYWDGQAKAETAAHKLLHPDYSYKPGAGRATKRKAARGARTSTRRRTTPKIEVPKLEPEVEAQLFVFSPSPSPLLLPTPLPFMADEGDRVELPSPCVTALSAHEPTTSTRSDAPAVPTLGTLLDWRLALDAVSNTERLVFPPCLLMTPDVLSSAQCDMLDMDLPSTSSAGDVDFDSDYGFVPSFDCLPAFDPSNILPPLEDYSLAASLQEMAACDVRYGIDKLPCFL